MRIDTRPKNGAWAPGDYMGKCDRCGREYQGDKRARNCAPCAYGDHVVLPLPTPGELLAGREVLAVGTAMTLAQDRGRGAVTWGLSGCPHGPRLEDGETVTVLVLKDGREGES